jgi:cysteine synthase A
MITGGGHITGCAAILKQHYPNLKSICRTRKLLVEVILLLTYTGIGAGFIPVNLHTDLLDGTIQVSKPLPMHKESKEGRNVC